MSEPRPRRRKTPYEAPRLSSRVYVKLAREHVGLLRFLLEAQSHVGILSVLDRHAAIAKITFSPDCERELRAFLEQARGTLPLQEISIR